MKNILVPRKTGDQRKRNHRFSIQKKIKKYIKDGSKGDLDLSNSPVEKLPDNLQVGGNLNLESSSVNELPQNLQLQGYLNLNRSEVTELPDNLKIPGSLYLKGSKVKKYLIT